VRSIPLVLLAVSCLLAAGSARAQEASTDSEEAEAPPPTPTEAEAMERFADAQALFERGDHAGALTEMERVYALLEGSATQYVILYDMGRAYEELFQYDRAISLYERYLAESPEDADDRADAQASLRALERLLGTIAITTNATGAHVWIGDADVGAAPGELRITAGHHVLELRAEGYEPVRREIDVAARTRLELDLPMSQLSDFHGISPAVFVSTTVAAGLALVVGIAIGTTALVMSNDAGGCPDRPMCSIDVPGTRRSINDFALAADVLYGAAGVFAIASVVLAFVTDWGGHDAATTGASLRVAPTLGGLVVSGTF
jgi:tetratricopeptide (TPR) repeat protein